VLYKKPSATNLDIVYIISLPRLSVHCPNSLRKRQHYYQLPRVQYNSIKQFY